jgi:hypothetical protein
VRHVAAWLEEDIVVIKPTRGAEPANRAAAVSSNTAAGAAGKPGGGASALDLQQESAAGTNWHNSGAAVP